MALPTVLLKAKSAIKKGAEAYKAGKQAKALKDSASDGPLSFVGNVIKIPLIIGGTIFALMVLMIIIIVAYPLVVLNGFAAADTGTTSGNANTYTEWALQIANDDSHGYSQCNRTGPDYDCSSLVWYSLVYGAGFSETELGGYPFSTYTEANILKSVGFTEYTFNGYESLQPGDILLRAEHTAIYIGNNQVVEASISETGGICGAEGDQTGQEILIDGDTGGNWNTYYRLEG